MAKKNKTTKTPGQVAYEAWAARITGYKATSTWSGISCETQVAWEKAADAVMNTEFVE